MPLISQNFNLRLTSPAAANPLTQKYFAFEWVFYRVGQRRNEASIFDVCSSQTMSVPVFVFILILISFACTQLNTHVYGLRSDRASAVNSFCVWVNKTNTVCSAAVHIKDEYAVGIWEVLWGMCKVCLRPRPLCQTELKTEHRDKRFYFGLQAQTRG